jgi:hypothetical protein
MRISSGAFLIVSAMALTSCDSGERTYALPPPPPLAEPAAHTPAAIDTTTRPRPVYTPPPKPPSWTLMPSQRTSCGPGRNFC